VQIAAGCKRTPAAPRKDRPPTQQMKTPFAHPGGRSLAFLGGGENREGDRIQPSRPASRPIDLDQPDGESSGATATRCCGHAPNLILALTSTAAIVVKR